MYMMYDVYDVQCAPIICGASIHAGTYLRTHCSQPAPFVVIALEACVPHLQSLESLLDTFWLNVYVWETFTSNI